MGRSDHQLNQIRVIDSIEQQINDHSVGFTLVEPVANYDTDQRICLTSVHFPKAEFINKVVGKLVNPLRDISPQHYYYQEDSLHMTIKNVRVINDPPNFNVRDIEKAKLVFSQVIPNHKKFSIYFFRLLLFTNNLALIGTTDPELDEIILELDRKLNEAGISDDKNYINSQYFFSNMTLMRFNGSLDDQFREKIEELSKKIAFHPYLVDSVTLLTANAALKIRQEIGTWSLS